MSNTPLQTARLLILPFTMEDVHPAFSWFGDPDVMRFTPTGPDPSPDATRARIDTYLRHQSLRGFSKWLLRDRHTGHPIGDAGLMTLDPTGDVELGFRLARPYWGIGLATEAAQAWVAHAFTHLSLTHLTAFAHPANSASLRVLTKLGFSSTGRRTVMSMEAETFRLAAPAANQ